MSDSQTAFPPLFRMAVKSGSLPAVLAHIRRGASVNGIGDRGRTPLMLAAAAGRMDICQLLLEEGADAAAVDADGQSVLAIARAAQQDRVASLLLGYLAPPAGQAESDDAPFVSPQAVVQATAAPAATFPLTQVAESSGLEDVLDEGGWDAEPEPGPPPAHDKQRFDQAHEVHSAISARAFRNTDADWSEVALELPSADVAALGGDDVLPIPQVRGLLLQAAVCGLVTSTQVVAASSGFADPRHDPSAFLASILEDLGCEVLDDAAAQSWPIRPLCAGETTADARDDARAAEEFLSALAGTDPDPLSIYESDGSRWKSLSKDEQAGLWKVYRQARRDLAFALSRAPHILDELVARLDRLSSSSEINDELASETSDELPPEESEEQDAAVHSLDSLDAKLARELGLAVMRARAEDNPEVGLADQLLELELPLHLIEKVRRALLLDPASAAACAELGIAVRKIERARTMMVESHQRFVLWIARRYQNRGLDLMDLVQEGNIGLIKAIEKFDTGRGAAFTTYATWWVRQSITRAIADLGVAIRIPVHRQEALSRLNRVCRAFLSEHGREASSSEAAALLDIPEAQVRLLQGLDFEFEPLDCAQLEKQPWGAKNPWIDDAPTPEGAAVAASLRRVVAAALGDLPDRERWVLNLRFGMDGNTEHTLEEIGDQVSVTRERIRQIEAKALRRLGHPGRVKNLRTFWEGDLR